MASRFEDRLRHGPPLVADGGMGALLTSAVPRLRLPEEANLRARLNAPAVNTSQDLYSGNDLKTGRIMAKDEDVCLHCGLCAERCPTGAWDMKKYLIDMTHAGTPCQHQAQSAA